MELSKWCTILPERSIPNYIILHICKRTFGSYKSLWPFEENKTSDTEHTSQLPWSRCLMTKTLNCSLSRRFIHARFMLKGSSLNKGKGIFSKTPWTWCKPQRSVLHLTERLLLRLRTWESSECFLITHVWFGPLGGWLQMTQSSLNYPSRLLIGLWHRMEASRVRCSREAPLTEVSLFLCHSGDALLFPLFLQRTFL